MENVIRVREYNYMGKENKGPSFNIYKNENTKVLIEDNEEMFCLNQEILKWL